MSHAEARIDEVEISIKEIKSDMVKLVQNVDDLRGAAWMISKDLFVGVLLYYHYQSDSIMS